MARITITKFAREAVDLLFTVGAEAVKDATFVRPASFSSATGQMNSAEVSFAVKAFLAPYRLSELGGTGIGPEQEKVLVRASELPGVRPVAGDYLVESATAQRRDVISALVDCTGQLWTLQTRASLNEDWGDLSAATVSEDRGDLTAVTASEDWMTIG